LSLKSTAKLNFPHPKLSLGNFFKATKKDRTSETSTRDKTDRQTLLKLNRRKQKDDKKTNTQNLQDTISDEDKKIGQTQGARPKTTTRQTQWRIRREQTDIELGVLNPFLEDIQMGKKWPDPVTDSLTSDNDETKSTTNKRQTRDEHTDTELGHLDPVCEEIKKDKKLPVSMTNPPNINDETTTKTDETSLLVSDTQTAEKTNNANDETTTKTDETSLLVSDTQTAEKTNNDNDETKPTTDK